jgi:hypothetical protein
MKTLEFGLGKIHYRMPNVVESMRLLSKLGIGSDGSVKDSELAVMASLIENMEPFIQKIECSKDGVAIETWTDALNNVEFLSPLSKIGAEIIAQFSGGEPVKGSKRKKS